MSGKDYKDALNELRLGSSFCEEMEKKLSGEIAEADEYTDEVTHVDVVPERRHKGLAIAAAAVLLIGGGGGLSAEISSVAAYGRSSPAISLMQMESAPISSISFALPIQYSIV